MADSFFTELKRRNVFKVGVAYLILAWVVVQVTQAAVPALNMPEWMNTVVFFLGIIGFPFALFFAWAFEVTPEGIKKESEIRSEDSAATHKGRKLEFAIIGLLIIVVGYFIYESRFSSETEQTIVEESSSNEIESAKQVAEKPEGTSIAVLPFVNMSSDPEQEYFTDGISEEILNVLVKINDLKVAGRTSSFAYKGKNQDLRTIGEELNVAHILEGSVRKSGTKIRITAQLVRSKDGFHLWSETYDREMVDIFDIQDEISKAIADALSISLSLGEAGTIVTHRTKIPAAYNAYLKARQDYSARGDKLQDAVLSLNKALVYDPTFVPAWSLLAKIYSVYPYHAVPDTTESWNEYLPLAKIVAERALALDPDSAEALVALGNIYKTQNDYAKAAEIYKKAIELAPRDADLRQQYSEIFNTIGLAKIAVEEGEKANELDPAVPVIMNNVGRSYITDHQFERAILIINEAIARDIGLFASYKNKIHALIRLRRFEELIETVENAPPKTFEGLDKDRDRYIAELKEIVKDPLLVSDDFKLVHFTFVLFNNKNIKQNYDVEPLDFFAGYARDFVYGEPWFVTHLTNDYWADQRVKDFIHRIGIFKAWQALGFPDFCKPVGEDDFECNAAK